MKSQQPISIGKLVELTRRIDVLEAKIKRLAEGERQRRLRDNPRCPICGMEWIYHRDDACTSSGPEAK